MSPAFQIMPVRTGLSEKVYKQFEKEAGCEGKGLACLRPADTEKLMEANDYIGANAARGTFAVGPSADGKISRQLPQVELKNGNISRATICTVNLN